MPLPDLIPTLISSAKERRKLQAKEERQRRLDRSFSQIKGAKTQEGKDDASLDLLAQGVSVPKDLRTARPDFRPLLKEMGASETLQEFAFHSRMSLTQAMTAMREEKKILTLEQATEIYINSKELQKTYPFGPEHFWTAIQHAKSIEPVIGKEATAKVLGLGGGGKPSPLQEKMAVINRILTTGTNPKDLDINQKGQLDAAGVTQTDLDNFTGIGKNVKLIAQAESDIRKQMGDVSDDLKPFAYDITVAKFLRGETEDIDPAAVTLLKRNLDPEGNLKEDIVLSKVERFQTLAEKLAKRQSGKVEAIDIPPELVSIVTDLQEQGVKTKAEARKLFDEAIKLNATTITEEQIKIILEMFD